MRAIDTNVLVRLIARDNRQQVERSERFIAGGAWVSNLVLAESVWVLQSVYGLRKAQLATAIDMLLEHRQLVLEGAGAVRTALDDFVANRGVGFTDCLIVAIARDNGHVPVGSFDKKLSRLDGAQAL
ncbi:MAG TPA: type II toxin-antitoxin system VapC family toxin [Oleiagrimonas sp.]|nr:type II toxin-antitoxin system VapC family toxin [Oleiagrimonas sp.]